MGGSEAERLFEAELPGEIPPYALNGTLGTRAPPARRRDARSRRLDSAALATALLVMLFESLFDPVRTVQQELVDQVEAPFSDRRFGVLPVESEDDTDDLPAVR